MHLDETRSIIKLLKVLYSERETLLLNVYLSAHFSTHVYLSEIPNEEDVYRQIYRVIT